MCVPIILLVTRPSPEALSSVFSAETAAAACQLFRMCLYSLDHFPILILLVSFAYEQPTILVVEGNGHGSFGGAPVGSA